jgi:hypothetical protein
MTCVNAARRAEGINPAKPLVVGNNDPIGHPYPTPARRR